MSFKKGDKVTWSSQAAGSWKTKTGFIVGVIDEKGQERFRVQVDPPKNSKAKPKIYYPRTSALKLA